MNIRWTDPKYNLYRFFLGEKEITNVIEADEEQGWVHFFPDPHNPKFKKKEYGRVHIVRFEGYDKD